MRRILALAVLASPALSQAVVFQESFEAGLTGWTATGLWNAEAATDPCGSIVAPFPGGTGAAYYGGANGAPFDPTYGGCNYNTGGIPNSGSLTHDAWIELPAGATSITMRYWGWSESEFCWGGWDSHLVWIDVEGGATLAAHECQFQSGSPGVVLRPWHVQQVDLSGLGGLRVRPRFEFETGDESANGYRGWFLDEIQILVGESGVPICPTAGDCPCPANPAPPSSGCPNSTGNSGNLAAVGATTVSADTLTLRASGLPPNASCLLVQAAASGTPVHFGDGVRCVSGAVQRLGALQAVNGFANWPPPAGPSISIRGLVPAGGGTRFYYVYYRDVLPYCTSANFNLTDTQRIVWGP